MASDFKGMSQEQIDEEVRKEQRALFDLRIAQRTKQVSIIRPHPSVSCSYDPGHGIGACESKSWHLHVQPFKPSDFGYHKAKVCAARLVCGYGPA